MTDSFVRGLERAARFGSLSDKIHVGREFERVGDVVRAARVYGGLLGEAQDEDYVRAQQGIIRVGLPWVEFGLFDAPNSVRFYNVMHKGYEDKERVSYVFSWDAMLYEHPERNFENNGMHYFAQETLASILVNEGILRRPPTASVVHSYVLMLEEIAKLGLQPQEAQRACRFMRDHFEVWPLTWSQIDCDTPGVVQDYDKQDQRDNTDIRGLDGYFRDLYLRGILNVGDVKEGDVIKQAVLCAEQSVEELDRRYGDLFGVGNGVYWWRPRRNERGRCAVVLGCNVSIGRFNISCDGSINHCGRARLVVGIQAQKFLH